MKMRGKESIRPSVHPSIRKIRFTCGLKRTSRKDGGLASLVAKEDFNRSISEQSGTNP
jgi:hypothetical protein